MPLTSFWAYLNGTARCTLDLSASQSLLFGEGFSSI